MTADARTATLTGVVGVLLGALVTVCAWIGVELDHLAPPHPPTPHELASRFGVHVVYVDQLHCGGIPADGCFRPEHAQLIYLRSELRDREPDVLLHELAHVLQHRTGVPGDECGADRIAIELGASTGGYDCSPR